MQTGFGKLHVRFGKAVRLLWYAGHLYMRIASWQPLLNMMGITIGWLMGLLTVTLGVILFIQSTVLLRDKLSKSICSNPIPHSAPPYGSNCVIFHVFLFFITLLTFALLYNFYYISYTYLTDDYTLIAFPIWKF